MLAGPLSYVIIFMLGSVSIGVSISFPSPTKVRLAEAFGFSDGESALFASLASLAAVLSPLISNPVLKRYGSRTSCQFISCIAVVAWAILIFAGEGAKLPAFTHRFVMGLAVGGYSSIIPTCIMEVSPVELRTLYGTMHQVGVTIGILSANFFGVFLSWRSLALLSVLLPISLIIMSPVLPIGHGGTSNVSPSASAGIKDDVMRFKPRIILALSLMFFQQVSGVGAVLSNFATILTSRFGPTLAASSKLLAVFLSMWFVCKIGRVNTWRISLFGSAASMFVLALSQCFTISPAMCTFAAFLYMFFFSVGLGPIPWYVIPEMFPDNLRMYVTGAASSLHWVLSFLVILLYPTCIEMLGGFGTLIIFTLVLVSGGIFGAAALEPGKMGDVGDVLVGEQQVPGAFDWGVDVDVVLSSDD